MNFSKLTGVINVFLFSPDFSSKKKRQWEREKILLKKHGFEKTEEWNFRNCTWVSGVLGTLHYAKVI